MTEGRYAFLGCESEYETAAAVIFGAPFDSTSSFRPGARFGPGAIRAESQGLETYSPYQDRDLEEISVFDAGDLELPMGSAARTLQAVEDLAGRVLEDRKLPVMLGGEHLLTLGAARSACRRFPDLHVVHLDAHADLREEYMGEALSHATVMRRVWEMTGDGRIHQFGIRSGTREEFRWAGEHTSMTRFGLDGLDSLRDSLADAPVYLTLDLDVLDPSVLGGTGTPEPGGVGFSALLRALSSLRELRVVGFDVMELAPSWDPTGASTAAACKLLREMLLLFVRK